MKHYVAVSTGTITRYGIAENLLFSGFPCPEVPGKDTNSLFMKKIRHHPTASTNSDKMIPSPRSLENCGNMSNYSAISGVILSGGNSEELIMAKSTVS